MICSKCEQDNWGTWTSSSTSVVHLYCKTCRKNRAFTYLQRRKAASGNHTKREWLDKLEQYNKCPKCNRHWSSMPKRPDKRYKFVWTKDHITPLNKGGSDSIENIDSLCYQCNFGKR
ncbi:HNH endonuclease [Spirosoma luteum]|uniref:HNH endonuclease n=1 Tax=Spirosoma luteum TaxID=431553 RepID=UPI0009FD1287